MENENTEANFIIVNNQKGFKYEKLEHNGKNINNEVPEFKDWLDTKKTEMGENGTIGYCVNCKLFFYFRDLQTKNQFNHGQCRYSDLAEFCEYCGELYFCKSICCFRKAIQMFKREFYQSFELDCQDYCFMLPIISIIFYFSLIFHLITTVRKKDKNIVYYNRPDRKSVICLGFTMSIVYSLVFIFHHIIIYLILLVYAIVTRKQVKKDQENNFIRY